MAELTTKEVAEILEVNETTVRKYARDGKLSCLPWGPGGVRTYRFNEESVLDFMLKREADERANA